MWPKRKIEANSQGKHSLEKTKSLYNLWNETSSVECDSFVMNDFVVGRQNFNENKSIGMISMLWVVIPGQTHQ